MHVSRCHTGEMYATAPIDLLVWSWPWPLSRKLFQQFPLTQEIFVASPLKFLNKRSLETGVNGLMDGHPTKCLHCVLSAEALLVVQLSQKDCTAEWVSCDQKWKMIFCRQYRSIFNHSDVRGLQSYQIPWNSKIRAIMPFKVIQDTHEGTNWKTVCDFLLVVTDILSRTALKLWHIVGA